MAKDRIQIPPEVGAKILFVADHTCCVCRERGRAVQIHHMDEDPSNNEAENLAVLCLLCHDNTQIKGGVGRKLNAKEVIQYRDDWVARVLFRRNKADEIAALKMADALGNESEALMGPADPVLVIYVQNLPPILAKAYDMAKPHLETGVTSKMLQGTYDLIDVVVQLLVHLASWFPEKHFNDQFPSEYFSHFVSNRFSWHRALAEPDGVGTGGSIVGPAAANAVLSDIKNAVNEMVTALLWEREGFKLEVWQQEWNNTCY